MRRTSAIAGNKIRLRMRGGARPLLLPGLGHRHKEGTPDHGRESRCSNGTTSFQAPLGRDARRAPQEVMARVIGRGLSTCSAGAVADQWIAARARRIQLCRVSNLGLHDLERFKDTWTRAPCAAHRAGRRPERSACYYPGLLEAEEVAERRPSAPAPSRSHRVDRASCTGRAGASRPYRPGVDQEDARTGQRNEPVKESR
jgi:hypothetical protein